jgi:PAS domain S-box-containing protein
MTESDRLMGNECRTNDCDCNSEIARQFASIFDRLADGFFTLDAAWRFTYVNPAAYKAFGASDELLGKVIWEVYPEARQTIFEIEFERVMQNSAIAEFEAFYPDVRIWLRVNAFPFNHGVAVSFADITGSRKAQRQLDKLDRELQQSARVSREVESFANAVVHDLRSPLAAILGFSQALSEHAVNELAPRSSHYLRRIESAAKQMLETTGAVKDFCWVAGAPVKRRLLDLSLIAGACISSLQDAELGPPVTCSVAPCMWADCDPRLMKLALEKLLATAWKNAVHQSTPSIEVGTELGPDKQMWYFVRDNGMGLGTTTAQGVTRPVLRLESNSFADEGIGLAIVKRIIDKHGGVLWAVATPGNGATIYFTLPSGSASG